MPPNDEKVTATIGFAKFLAKVKNGGSVKKGVDKL